MKFRVITISIAIIAASFGSAMAQPTGGNIGLYWDANGTDCVGTVEGSATLYILAKPDPSLPSGGITGAEFRVKGKAAGMFLIPTANPNSNIALGDPFSDESKPLGERGGTNIAFPDCQLPDANGNVLLYTITVVLTSPLTDVVFEVDKRDPPINLTLGNFALVNACDGPTFTKHEVTTGIAYMNHSSPGECGVVAIQDKTWGQIKSIYN